MRAHIELQEKSQDQNIPVVVQSAINLLRNLEYSLNKVINLLTVEAERRSEYYSLTKLQERVGRSAISSTHDLLDTLAAELKIIAEEARYAQETYLKHGKLIEQETLRNKSLIDALHRAAANYVHHCNDALLVNIKKVSSPAPLLLACSLFADFVEIEFNDSSELTCTVRKLDNHNLMFFADLFNQRIAIMRSQWKKNANSAVAEKEIQFALDCLAREVTVISRQFPDLDLQFSFIKNGLNSAISVSKKNQEAEMELNALSGECQALIAKYKPFELPKKSVGYCVANNHFLNNKHQKTTGLTQQANELIQVYDDAHEKLEQESKQAYETIIADINRYYIEINNACSELKLALTELKKNIDRETISANNVIYARFVSALNNVNGIQLGTYSQAIKNKLHEVHKRFDGKIHEKKQVETDAALLKCKAVLHKSLIQANDFATVKDSKLILLEREKIANEWVEIVKQALLTNLSFWNKQLYRGMSSNRIGKVKVPCGIAAMINCLNNSGHNSIETLKNLKAIANERVEAGSIRFCFFNVRIDSTNRFYRLFQRLLDFKNLSEARLTEFRDALCSIQGKTNEHGEHGVKSKLSTL